MCYSYTFRQCVSSVSNRNNTYLSIRSHTMSSISFLPYICVYRFFFIFLIILHIHFICKFYLLLTVNFNLCTVVSNSLQMKPYAHGELAISLFLTILILYFHLSVSQYVADRRRGRYY